MSTSLMKQLKIHEARKTSVAKLLALAFILGLLLGGTLIASWYTEKPLLQVAEDEIHARSTAIVGMEKSGGGSMITELSAELRAGRGRVLINVPPYENEDTQSAMIKAKKAAAQETNYNLAAMDIIISIKTSQDLTIAGPSAGASTAVAIVAAIRAIENSPRNQIYQDAIVSATIDEYGRLGSVGGIVEKYEGVKRDGRFRLFIVATTQAEHLPSVPNLEIRKASNLRELLELMLW